MAADALIVSRPNGEPTGPLTLREAHDAVSDQTRRRGSARDGWRLRVRGDEFGVIHNNHDDLMDRWDVLAKKNNKKGDVIVVDIIDHPYSVIARWVDEPDPPVRDTSGNDDIDVIYTGWHSEYPHSRNAGICVYKFTNGVPSQHCRWNDNDGTPGDGANASDEFLSNMEEMQDAAAWGVAQYKRFQATKGDDGLPIGRLIIANRIWDPFQGWHYYGGVYHLHNHMEGRWWLIHGYAGRC